MALEEVVGGWGWRTAMNEGTKNSQLQDTPRGSYLHQVLLNERVVCCASIQKLSKNAGIAPYAIGACD
jgi:hypothetical protein